MLASWCVVILSLVSIPVHAFLYIKQNEFYNNHVIHTFQIQLYYFSAGSALVFDISCQQSSPSVTVSHAALLSRVLMPRLLCVKFTRLSCITIGHGQKQGINKLCTALICFRCLLTWKTCCSLNELLGIPSI
uniref:Secreted protein n=1 Tax=Arundo donax TaxID=35708 RepID=A0A0A9FP82_ARUDO